MGWDFESAALRYGLETSPRMRQTKLGERESNFQTPRLKRERPVMHRQGQSQACRRMASPVPGAGANGTTKEGCARQHFASYLFFSSQIPSLLWPMCLVSCPPFSQAVALSNSFCPRIGWKVRDVARQFPMMTQCSLPRRFLCVENRGFVARVRFIHLGVHVKGWTTKSRWRQHYWPHQSSEFNIKDVKVTFSDTAMLCGQTSDRGDGVKQFQFRVDAYMFQE